jgi:serine/threonine-protein kinase HipA
LIDLIQNHSSQPSVDKLEFIKIIIFNYLIGNADAHGKNFSFLYFDGKPCLAPAYDLLSTAVYPQLSKKMAMRIGRKDDPSRVFLHQWQTLVENTASARKVLENSLQYFANKLPDLADSLQNNLERQGITSPIFEQIKTLIQKRAKHINLYFPQ